MLKISPIPLVPVKIPLALMRIWILLVLLWRIESGTCLLPVSQSVHPREAIPAKLFHGPKFVLKIHPFPIAVQIPVTNFVQRKSIDEHGGHQGIGDVMEKIESAGFGAQGEYVHIESLKTHMIIFVKGAHFSDWHEDFLEVPIRTHIRFGKRRENLLYRIEMANFSQSGFGETFFADGLHLHTFGSGGVEFLQVPFQIFF